MKDRKTEKISEIYETVFVRPEETILIQGAVDLINHFNQLGLMLPTTVDHYQGLASKGVLVVAKNNIGQVVGTAAYTQFYNHDVWEFGGWAVAEEHQHRGLGMKLVKKLFKGNSHTKTIAFGNENSGPVLEALGAEMIQDHAILPQEAFTLCANCPKKPKVGCCDTIYNLAPVVTKMVLEDISPIQFGELTYSLG